MYPQIIIYLIILLTGLIIIRSCLILVTVKHNSMAPSLIEGDRVLVVKHWPRYLLKIGQIVLIKPPMRVDSQNYVPYIKRILGLPNSTVIIKIEEIDEYKRKLYIEDFDSEGRRNWVIPNGFVFVRGDSIYSTDSRDWGPIPLNRIVGLVIFKFPLTTK